MGVTTMIKDKLPPICRRCGSDMTDPKNHVPGLLVRKRFMDSLAIILSGRGHNNVIITGRAGVGKTAVVQALAKAVYEGAYPVLEGRVIANISIDMLLHDCYTPAERGVRIQGLFEEAAENHIILFIDEIHRLCGFGADSLGNITKPFLCRDDIQVIGATTTDEYQRFICPEEALTRRFEDIEVMEPGVDEIGDILAEVYTRRYSGRLGDKRIFATIAECAKQYLPERGDPDRSLSLLDNTLSWMANNGAAHQAIRPEFIYNALSVRTGLAPHSILERVSGRHISGLADSLSKEFSGWRREARCASEILKEALTRSCRDKGPLCSLILYGPDTALLEAFAMTAAREMGFAGRTLSVNLDVEPFPQHRGATNAYKALILNMGRQIRGVETALNIMRSDCAGAPLFLLVPCDMPERSTVGFGSQGYSVPAQDNVAKLSSILYGNGASHHIMLGSPCYSGPDDVLDTFGSILRKGLERIYSEKAPDVILDTAAQKKILEMALRPDAWSAMHTAADRMIQEHILSREQEIIQGR